VTGPRSLVALCLALLSMAAPTGAGAEPPQPRREDHGALVALHVYGSYREMGRQQAELLGALAREAFAFDRADYARLVGGSGLVARAFDTLGLPLASALLRRDASGMGEQIAGLAEGLGVAPRQVLRAAFALDAASTVFVATRSATADGAALVGRNADWGDAGGRRRPVVTLYHPTNGDLAHIAAGWPLLTLPVVGLNEAGFALSLNFFDTEPLLRPLGGSWPHRRALQTARSVEDGIRIFEEAGAGIAFACFMAMADAAGAIALVECRPEGGCAVLRPRGDWLAHANHARSAAMLAHDRYRSPDSFARQAAMEAAVRGALGALTPERATAILRDRSGERFPNAPSLANLFVLNAAVVAPAQGVLWHATSQQPSAPFGAYRGFSLDPRTEIPELPAAPELATPAFARELEAIERARRAIRAQRDAAEQGDTERRRSGYAEASALWDALAAETPPLLDPARIALARAHALYGLGELERAYDALAPSEAPDAPFDARAGGLAARALLADRLGRRDEALRLWRATLAQLDAGPEFNVFGALRALAEAGLREPSEQRELPITWWDVGVPR
jgi:tetratricopeptide (TPR) repeat protein